LKETYDFVNKVSDLDVKVDNYMVSFDVESLFTNVPTRETIELILQLAYPNNDESFLFHDLDKKAMRKLLIFCTQESHFQFNGVYYDQIDGVAMGSPLGPLFANVFMSEFERKHMAQLKELGVIKWFRYVDDVFATMSDKKQVNRVLDFLNKHHANLKFTTESETKNQLQVQHQDLPKKDLHRCISQLEESYSEQVQDRLNSLSSEPNLEDLQRQQGSTRRTREVEDHSLSE
jgi:hypothetical protein